MKARVLIVDDEEDLCVQLAEALEHAGFEVTFTPDPLDAAQMIDTEAFGIILLDYKMQGMTGIDLLRAIKDKSPAAKVFMVTGRPYIEKMLVNENVAHLVTEVIPKPFDVDSLVKKASFILS